MGYNFRALAKSLLVLTLVAGLLAWSAKEAIYNRVVTDKTTVEALLAGSLDEVPYSSTGLRVHSWAEALKWIAERPITGWGLDARVDVMQLADHFPDDIKARFGHLHNGYLEILLGFGAVGFFYLCLLWVLLLRRIKLAASKDLYAFALYSSVFFLVLNMFESFFVKSSGEFAVSLFIAGGYSQYLAKSLGDVPRLNTKVYPANSK